MADAEGAFLRSLSRLAVDPAAAEQPLLSATDEAVAPAGLTADADATAPPAASPGEDPVARLDGLAAIVPDDGARARFVAENRPLAERVLARQAAGQARASLDAQRARS